MSMVVNKADADIAVETLRQSGEDAYIMGEVVKSDESVILK